MPDLHLLTGAYALDALDDVERRAMDRHLRDCAECTGEVRDFHEATAMLADRVSRTPPAGLRGAVLEQISRTRQVSPDVRPRLPRLSWRGLVTAAAAVLLAGSAGLGGIAVQDRRAEQEARVEAARYARVITDPSGVRVAGRPSIGGDVAVYASRGQAVLAADRLPAAPQGRAYQLWVIQGEVIRSAGLLTLEGGAGRALIEGVPAGASVAVSVEPEGGSSQPTTTPILAIEVA